MQHLLKTVAAYNGAVTDKKASTVDEKMLAKAALTSQPPRAHDVPDLVAYTLKWGGLPKGSFVNVLAEEFEAEVPSDRVVSGNWFRKIADLKFPPSELPAHFVNALLITHAKADEGVSDGVYARYITLAEIDSFANKKLRVRSCNTNGCSSGRMQ